MKLSRLGIIFGLKKKKKKMKTMNEFEARDCIYETGKNANSVEDIAKLIAKVKDEYNYDYGVAPRCVGAVCATVADYLCREMGLTGYQAGCIMWDFITKFIKSNNKTGLKLIDYDEMLYPQYDYAFEKIISEDVWENLQKAARENLENEQYANVEVIKHWQSIADGEVPFGYKVGSY